MTRDKHGRFKKAPNKHGNQLGPKHLQQNQIKRRVKKAKRLVSCDGAKPSDRKRRLRGDEISMTLEDIEQYIIETMAIIIDMEAPLDQMNARTKAVNPMLKLKELQMKLRSQNPLLEEL